MTGLDADRIVASLDRIGDLLAMLVDMGKAPVLAPAAKALSVDVYDLSPDEVEALTLRSRAEVEAADEASRVERDRLLTEAKARAKAGIKPLPQATNLARSSRGRPKETA